MQRTHFRACFAALALALAASAPLAAQVTPPDTVPVPPPQDVRPGIPLPVAPDTVPSALVARDTAAVADTVPVDEGMTPRGAFIRSLVVPGWGQSAIGADARGGVYFALETASLWMLYTSSRRLSEAEQRERVLRETGQRLPTEGPTALVRARRAQREDWITLSVFWLFFSGADAFVAAHLSDFEAHVGALPTPDGGVQLQATIPVGP